MDQKLCIKTSGKKNLNAISLLGCIECKKSLEYTYKHMLGGSIYFCRAIAMLSKIYI